MKKIFTTKLRPIAIAFNSVILAIFVFSTNGLFAQNWTEDPAPFCKPGFTTMTTGPCTNNYDAGLGYVKFQDFNYADDACPTTFRGVYRYFSQEHVGLMGSMLAGKSETLYATHAQWNSGGVNTGSRAVNVWVDYNNDGVFDKDEFIKTGKNLASHPKAGTVFERNIETPCDIATRRIVRVRVLTNIFGYNDPVTYHACYASFSYGECWDFDLEILPADELACDFIVPKVVYANSSAVFYNRNLNKLYTDFFWSKGQGVESDEVNFVTKFPAPGEYEVTLTAQNCRGAISETKSVTVTTPSPQSPIADFLADKNIVNVGEEFTLYDISDYGPASWEWRINGHTNPRFKMTEKDAIRGYQFEGSYYIAVFSIFELGDFNVSLTATNDQGANMRNKTQYISVVPFSDLLLGMGTTETELNSGRIQDAGAAGKYPTGPSEGAPSRNRMLIKPCGAEEVYLTIEQLILGSASHNLKVWDGEDNTGTPLHPADGFRMGNTTIPTIIKAVSGAMYLEFDAVADGSDEGLILTWDSKVGKTNASVPYFEQVYPTQAYTNAEVSFEGHVTNLYGISQPVWVVDGFEVSPSFVTGNTLRYIFYEEGNHEVCYEVNSCVGDTSFCRTISVAKPIGKTAIDFNSSDIRPVVNQNIQLNAIVDKADRFQWQITPPSFTINSGNLLSKYPNVSFNQSGAYSISLRAWSSLDSASTTNFIVKNNVVIVVDQCIPIALESNNSVSNNTVNVSENGVQFYNHYSTSGVPYSAFLSINDPAINLNFGGQYTLELQRDNNADTVSRAVYIDYNANGEYEPNELILHQKNSRSKNSSVTFTVPDLYNAYLGTTRMRVIVTSGNTNELIACGPGNLAEYKDYKITLNRNPIPPTITLNGLDTLDIEIGSTYTEYGATAYDVTDGDMTSSITITSNLEVNQSGLYYVKYSVTNSSGVTVDKFRQIIVSYDKTAPVMTLLGNAIDTIEVNSGKYNDLGVTAIDNIDGDVSSLVKIIGAVDESEIGTYALIYTVSDVQGNTNSVERIVHVLDRTSPEFVFTTGENLQLGKFWYDQTEAVDNYWKADQIDFRIEYGANGPVRWDIPGSYPVTYKATDGSGNYNEASRTYVVADLIAPTIILNSPDTIIHDVKTPYQGAKPSIYDNYYPNHELTITENSNVDSEVIGVYQESFTVTDPAGNKTTKVRYVKVVDRVSPVISGEDFCTKAGTEFNVMTGLNISDNYYSEGDLLPLVEVVKTDLDVWFEGRYYIAYAVTDPSGNKSRFYTRNILVSEDCDVVTSVDDVLANINFNIYPNPNAGIFNIDFARSGQKVEKVEILNSLGAVVQVLDISFAQDNIEVDLSNESEGIYLIRLTSSNGNNSVKKVVVNK